MSQAKTVYSDSDSGEDVSAEFPVGLLRCTPDKPAFSRTPSPNKDYHQARLLAQPTQLHTPSRAPRITGRSRQQRPQLARPADLGRHEGVGRRLVCGRTAAVRSPEGRAPARSHDGSDRRPASQARLHLVVGRLHQAPESPLLARGPARLRRRLVRRRVSPSHGPPGALRASVCVLVVGQSAKFWRRFLREERVCIYVYVFTNNVHDHELREQTNEPEGRLHEKRDQTSAPRTNKQTRRVCSCSANRFANK